MAAKLEIADGIYFIHPAGCDWEAVRMHSGKIVGHTEASLAQDHELARDRWGGITPGDRDEAVPPEVAEAVVRAWRDYSCDDAPVFMENFVVERAAN